ncbi:MAG: hypothetical protein SGI88_09085 [Candidatus Hydrogenedentes bacterium]|nr:hypothetical protein [Candidatus Hydrogenedentota bacterium]
MQHLVSLSQLRCIPAFAYQKEIYHEKVFPSGHIEGIISGGGGIIEIANAIVIDQIIGAKKTLIAVALPPR